MTKPMKSALIRFLCSVTAIVIGTALLGSMASSKMPAGGFPGEGMRGQKGQFQQGQTSGQSGTQQAAPAGQP